MYINIIIIVYFLYIYPLFFYFYSTLSTIVQRYQISIPLLGFITVTFYVLENPPERFASVATIIREEGSFALYWIILGVLSSIGLGSGLHTFVLFLGPHIMRIANIAILHGSTDFTGKIQSYFTWPENGWDIGALAQAFSPSYAVDAWDLHTHRLITNNNITTCLQQQSHNEHDLPLDTTCQTMIANDLSEPEVSFFAIVIKVWWACFLWGFGTSLGELPPYFIALAAARAGTALDELNEIAQLEKDIEEDKKEEEQKKAKVTDKTNNKRSKSKTTKQTKETIDDDSSTTMNDSVVAAHPHHHASFVDRAKVWVFECVKQYGFWAILVAASIPNPLFDLAGLTCGTFGVSFWTFFGATFIGKAVIKVSIQAFFIIAITKYGPILFEFFRTFAPASIAQLITNFEKNFERSQHCVCVQETSFTDCEICCVRDFHAKGSSNECISLCNLAGTPDAHNCASSGKGSNSIISDLWGYFLTLMILWFVSTLIQSLVSEYLVRQILAQQNISSVDDTSSATTVSVSEPAKPKSSSGRTRRNTSTTDTDLTIINPVETTSDNKTRSRRTTRAK